MENSDCQLYNLVVSFEGMEKTMKEYPLTLAAAKQVEGDKFALGKAIIKECGKDGSLKDCREFLKANDIKYSLSMLSDIRRVALNFRVPEIAKTSWSAASEARTSEFLDAVIKGTPKGTRVTQRTVRAVRKAHIAHEKAVARAEGRPVPPPSKIGPPPKAEVPYLAIEAEFLAKAAQASRLAKECARDIAEILRQLTPKGVAALTEAALEAANDWTNAAQIVRRETVDQRGHISVFGTND